MPVMNRRDFIASSAAAALFAATRTRAYAAEPRPIDDALADLKKRLGDRLVAPDDARYETYRKVRNRAYDDVRPRALVMATSVEDIRFALQWAAANKVAVVPRCGGHSYVGQSTSDGLVVSLPAMSTTTIDKPNMTADIAAGALNVDANFALLREGVALPTGSCPSVGIAGLTLGGGIGFSSRKWGLMVDNLIGATMVLASGEVITVDAQNRPEILWALRGGGGGHFGVVTSFRFAVRPVEPIAEYDIDWPWASADKVLDAWQRFAPEAPDELFSVLTLARGKTEPRLTSYGRYLGSPADLRKLIAPLIAIAKPTSSPKIYASTFWDSHIKGPKCEPDPAQCHSWNHPKPGRYQQASYVVKSDFYTRHLDDEGRATLLAGFAKIQQQPVSWGCVILDALGGAINRVAPGATAYVHRGHKFQAEYVTHWNPRLPAAQVDGIRTWMRALYAAMRPHASGEAYQNYPDLDLPDWKAAYFGSNLIHLERAKAMLDPSGLFRGRQVLDPSRL